MGNKRKNTSLTPGSKEAEEAGCICPSSDNNNGDGMPMAGGLLVAYWTNKNCKLHGSKDE